jgi:Tol biopolymer transport system component
MSIPLVASLITVVSVIVFSLAAIGFYTRLKGDRAAATWRLTSDRAQDTQPDVSPDGQQVVFVSDRSGHKDIWLLRIKGSVLKSLTHDRGENDAPAWSPDGSQIAFQRTEGAGEAHIFLMNADGSGQHVVEIGERPAWSPDGKRLAFQSTLDGVSGVFVREFAASTFRLQSTPVISCSEPAWSPDGKKIVYSCEKHLFVMDSDGGNVQQLNPGAMLAASAPVWSPDGKRIAFAGSFGRSRAIFLMNVDGTGITRVSDGEGEAEPAFSRDGQRVFFESTAPGNSDIFSGPVPRTLGRRLTFNSADDQSPSLSPTGGQIAFSSDRSGKPDIFVQDLGTGQLQNLTNNPADDEHPAWSPDGTWIAFDSNRTGHKQVFVMKANGSDASEIPGEAFAPAWSPDGADLVAAGKTKLLIVHLSDRSTRGIETGEPVPEWPAWSPDGASIAFSARSRIFLVSSQGGTVRPITDGTHAGSHPAWRSDGSIAFECDCGSGMQIVGMRIDGSDLRFLTSGPSRNISPSFSKDGFRLFFSTNRDGNFEIYEIFN